MSSVLVEGAMLDCFNNSITSAERSAGLFKNCPGKIVMNPWELREGVIKG